LKKAGADKVKKRMHWVFDTSITMAWCFEDEKTSETEALFDRLAATPAIVPQIWPLEVANVLTLALRHKRISIAQRTQFIHTLEALPIQIDMQIQLPTLNSILHLSDSHQLTAYDTAYLELAIRFNLPLATLDEALKRAARKVGVELL
jgi:predicted nucleic acid-binding protein